MHDFKNFRLSTALTPVQQDLKDTFSIEFCEDENGIDWYHCRAFFSPDTWKFTYDATGRILSASMDATMLRPTGVSVAEINAGDFPAEFGRDSSVFWRYQDGAISLVPPDPFTLATERREQDMAAATLRINALTQAQEDGDITPEEETELATLREYRSSLRRLDLSVAPDIDWPVAPVL